MVFSRFATMLALWASLAAGGCASSDVAAIKSASHDEIRAVQVLSVDVAVETPKPNPQLQAALREELNRKVPGCARGGTPHRMNVTIVEFDEQNVGQTLFLGDEIELGGRVELVDEATGEQTGEYYVQRSFFWDGVLGAAMMPNAHRRLSSDFADSVCDDVSGVRSSAS